MTGGFANSAFASSSAGLGYSVVSYQLHSGESQSATKPFVSSTEQWTTFFDLDFVSVFCLSLFYYFLFNRGRQPTLDYFMTEVSSEASHFTLKNQLFSWFPSHQLFRSRTLKVLTVSTGWLKSMCELRMGVKVLWRSLVVPGGICHGSFRVWWGGELIHDESSVRLGSGEFGEQAQTLSALSWSLNRFWMVSVVYQWSDWAHNPAVGQFFHWEQRCHDGASSICIHVLVGATYQSNIHTNARSSHQNEMIKCPMTLNSSCSPFPVFHV